jgi:hypothetical protein
MGAWLAAALFSALTLILTYPLSRHPGSTSLGSDADVHLFTWTLAWDVHAFLDTPWSIFDANIFFPYDRTLAFSENLIGSAFFAAPVMWLTGNPVLAMNAVALLSVALCGLGAYVLARRLGLSASAAIVCGIIFAFSPARFFRFAQMHLTAIQWIPFTLAFLHAYFDRGLPRRSSDVMEGAKAGRRRDLRIAIGFFTLQALSSLHGAVYLTLAIAVFLIHRVVAGAPVAFAQRLRDVGVTGAVLLIPAALLVPPYLRVQQDMGLVRTLEDWIPARESFLASPTHLHAWLLARLFDTPLNERASAFLFPGYVPIVLAAVAVVTMRRSAHRSAVVLYAAIALIAIAFSAGPPLSVWPYVYWLPGLNFIRVPSRFFLLAVFAIAVLAAIGYEATAARLRPRARTAVAALVCALLIAEFASIPLPLTPYRVELASADRWLAAQPKPFAVAEVPVGPFMRYHSTYMLHSMAHWQKTVHGHSGLLPPLHEKLYDQLRTFPDEASLQTLSEIGVTHIVVHSDMYRPGEWDVVERRIDLYRDRLTLEHGDKTGRVYRLTN